MSRITKEELINILNKYSKNYEQQTTTLIRKAPTDLMVLAIFINDLEEGELDNLDIANLLNIIDNRPKITSKIQRNVIDNCYEELSIIVKIHKNEISSRTSLKSTFTRPLYSFLESFCRIHYKNITTEILKKTIGGEEKIYQKATVTFFKRVNKEAVDNSFENEYKIDFFNKKDHTFAPRGNQEDNGYEHTSLKLVKLI